MPGLKKAPVPFGKHVVFLQYVRLYGDPAARFAWVCMMMVMLFPGVIVAVTVMRMMVFGVIMAVSAMGMMVSGMIVAVTVMGMMMPGMVVVVFRIS